MDVVGSPRLTVQLTAPRWPRPRGRPAGQLVVFAKLYDVGPDGDDRAAAPADLAGRASPTSTKPVTIELPAIVHRFEAGHRLVVVLAGGDMAYRGLDVRAAGHPHHRTGRSASS